jgi:hypothetical protein
MLGCGSSKCLIGTRIDVDGLKISGYLKCHVKRSDARCLSQDRLPLYDAVERNESFQNFRKF